MPQVSTHQIRAARALLNWTQGDLAERVGVSKDLISKIEKGDVKGSMNTVEKIESAFIANNLEFTNQDGVQRQRAQTTFYNGTDGFRAFMDDVYETAKREGGEICLFNARPDLFIKWLGADWYAMHAARMLELKDNINMKITAKEGDSGFIASAFAEYRWFPEAMFNEKAFYAYGNKLGFMSFEENDLQIMVLNQGEFTHAFRVLFGIGWDNVARKPEKGDAS